MKNYVLFLAIALVTSFCFEYLANTVGDGTLFQSPNWMTFFLVWYGSWQTLTYLFLKNKPLWSIALIWAILGPVLEILVFKRFNLIVDPIIYAVLFTLPIFLVRTITSRAKSA